MPEPPQPPDDLSPSEQDAWRRGMAAGLRLVGGHVMTLAGAVEGDDPVEESDEDSCPECGGDLIKSFDGELCMECDYDTT